MSEGKGREGETGGREGRGHLLLPVFGGTD